jgi:epoxyqueuosine reductase QueG
MNEWSVERQQRCGKLADHPCSSGFHGNDEWENGVFPQLARVHQLYAEALQAVIYMKNLRFFEGSRAPGLRVFRFFDSA